MRNQMIIQRKQMLCILLVLTLICGLLPLTALADEDQAPFEVSFSNCTLVATDEDMDAPVYRCNIPAPFGTKQISFIDYKDKMEDGTIAACGTSYVCVSGTYVAPVDDYLFETGCDADWTRASGHEEDSFEGFYAFLIMTDDDSCCYYLVPTESLPFTLSVGKVVGFEENGYTYSGFEYAPENSAADQWGFIYTDFKTNLYTVEVPFGTSAETLTFSEARIAYAYDVEGMATSLSTKAGGYEDGGKVGETTGVLKSGQFGDIVRVQTPYDDSWSSDTLYAIKFVLSHVLTATVGDTTLPYFCEEDVYTYQGYGAPDTTKNVYTVMIPFGTEEVKLAFSTNAVAYNYSVKPENRPIVINDMGTEVNWLAGSYPYDGVGVATADVKVDCNNDGVFDYIQIQTPYQADYSGGEFLYAVTFRYELSASDAGVLLPVASSDIYYKDYYSDPNAPGLPVYTVEIPEGTKEVELDFGAPVIAYNYKADGKTYIDGYYADKSAAAYAENPEMAPLYVGEQKKTVSVDADNDGTIDFIQVQTPYIYNSEGNDYGSISQYAVTFVYKNGAGSGTANSGNTVSYASLLKGIAASCAYDSDPWTVMDEKAYDGQDHSPYGGYHSSSDAAKAMAIIANSSDPLMVQSAVSALDSFDPSGAYAEYTAPFVLMAYKTAGYSLSSEREQALKNCIVNALNNTDTQLYSADTVGMLIPALQPYYTTDSSVKVAVDTGIAWLSEHQRSDGSWGTAESDAMAIIALSAYGIDAHTDSRFIKAENGVQHSAVEALLGYGLFDASGFGHTRNDVYSETATEQGFRALVAYARFREKGSAYNIYTEAKDASATVNAPDITSTIDPKPINTGTSNETFSVSFILQGNGKNWITDTLDVKSGSTVFDVLVSELTKNGFSYRGNSNYISFIIQPSGSELGEYSTGKNSGWMYKVNGNLPYLTVGEYKLSANDSILFFYTEDWTQESGTTTLDMNTAGISVVMNTVVFTDVPADAYYADAVAWAIENGITVGTSDTIFSPDGSCTRGQIVTFLWRAAGEPEPETDTCAFTDMDADAYYYKAGLWAVENGITRGTSGTTFSPDTECTRGQMATFLYRFNGFDTLNLKANPFDDVTEGTFYYDAVLWAAMKGITKGTSETTFAPDAACTRGQTVTFLYRYLTK